VKGLLADVNIEGHFRVLLQLLQAEARRELWTFLNLGALTFPDLHLLADTLDVIVWQTCQREQLVLVTGNRNARGPDSLEWAIRTLNTPASLPVITLADPNRILADRPYGERVADRLLETLYDLENYRGAGRIYVP
jgi:hypothetical protein